MSLLPLTDLPARGVSGEPFGKYLLLDRIGHGGMAEVFRAVARGPEGFQRAVVIKRILPHLSQDPTFVRMFIDEAKVSGLLSHPNLVQIYEFGKINESFFIAMEHVHGRTLTAVHAKLAKLDRLAPVAATVEIGRQICVGLHHAHSLRSVGGQPLGIVHRDISPSNVMLAFHGGVTILDFGIARMAEGLRETHTQAGGLKGKISYMSPEQIRNETVDQRSDIFAVGVVLHEMLTGRRLFRSSSTFDAARKVMEMPIPLPSERNPTVPPALDRLVMHALARERDARYATAGEMATELDQLVQEARMSPREHAKLLDDLFPNEASATDIHLMLPAEQAPSEEIRDLDISAQKIPDDARDPGETDSPERDRPGTVVKPESPKRGAGVRRSHLAVAVLCVAALGTLPVVLHATKRSAPRRALALTRVMPPAPVPFVTPPATDARCFLDSSPQGATVTRMDDGSVVGRTPVTIVVPRSESPLTLRFERTGRKPVTRQVVPDLDKSVRVDLSDGTVPPVARRKKTITSTDFRNATLVNPFTM